MRLSKKVTTIFGIALVVIVVLLYVYVLPVVNKVNEDLNAYETRVAYRDNYKLHTTPLSKDVVDDICSKLEIKVSSENCKPNVVVYAPELFDEIKVYFKDLPNQDKTYDIVQDKLGAYLVYCENPDPEGDYRCLYDIRRDEVYPIFFYFDKDGFYWRLIANIGGS